MAQTTQNILMIRPVAFSFNDETAVNNAFQKSGDKTSQVQLKALQEFNAMVQLLTANGVHVMVADDTPEPHTPDSIFPNNWFSTHEEGLVVLYPMFAENRRLERRPDLIQWLGERFILNDIIDFTEFEKENKFLEGTGSMVLDRDLRICYACISPRTDKHVLQLFSNKLGYELIAFHAVDKDANPIYHTNVVMTVGTNFVLGCLDCIPDDYERALLRQSTNKQWIEISTEQMNQFAGNMLEVKTVKGESVLVMSQSAYQSLTPQQITLIEKHVRVLHPDIPTIEQNGGGSVRCMMAEIFLPSKNVSK